MDLAFLVFKLFIVIFVLFTSVHGSVKDDIKEKVEEVLKKDGKVKRVVNVVNERSQMPTTATPSGSDVVKDGSTLTTKKTSEKGKADRTQIKAKPSEKKKTGETTRTKTSESGDNATQRIIRTTKTTRTTEQHGKVKQEKLKVEGTTKPSVEQTDQPAQEQKQDAPSGVFHTLSNVKNSILEKVGLGSTPDEVTPPESAKETEETITITTTKKSSGKGKKKAKETGDL